MTHKWSFRRARSALSAELDSIRRRDPDLDASDLAGFTLPLLVRAAGVVALGAVPMLVVRNGDSANDQLIPIVASLALTLISAAVLCWLLSIVISGVVVMVLYRTRPATTSRLVMRRLSESFKRIGDLTSELTLLALLAGLLSLALGLPERSSAEQANSVLDDLLTAQIGVLLGVLGFALIAESVRTAADVVDDQSLLLAWPWALLIASVSWSVATVIGPFEATRMLTLLLKDWLPATVDGVPQAQLIAELIPPSARWWVAFGPLPVIALIWAYQAWHHGDRAVVRRYLSEDGADEAR